MEEMDSIKRGKDVVFDRKRMQTMLNTRAQRLVFNNKGE